MPTATKPEPLTDRQGEIYQYVWEYTCREGCQPSYRDIGRRFGIGSANGIVGHMTQLERRGWIQIPKGHSRSIRFLFTPEGREFKGFRPVED